MKPDWMSWEEYESNVIRVRKFLVKIAKHAGCVDFALTQRSFSPDFRYFEAVISFKGPRFEKFALGKQFIVVVDLLNKKAFGIRKDSRAVAFNKQPEWQNDHEMTFGLSDNPWWTCTQIYRYNPEGEIMYREAAAKPDGILPSVKSLGEFLLED